MRPASSRSRAASWQLCPGAVGVAGGGGVADRFTVVVQGRVELARVEADGFGVDDAELDVGHADVVDVVVGDQLERGGVVVERGVQVLELDVAGSSAWRASW